MEHGLVKLILKKNLSETLSNWRPISLMLVQYKLVTKMLLHRVHTFLHDGLHPFQYGFVPRR